MSTSHRLLKLMRQIHLYVGVFISPALLFFAFTGALQTFSLHETTQGSSYKPPAWISTLAQLHKKQTTTVPVRKPRADKPADAPSLAIANQTGAHEPNSDKPRADKPSEAAPKPAATPAPKPKSHLPMKIFFLLIAVGLFTSTLTGIYMSYKYTRSPLLITALLVAGLIVPLALLPF
jgi:hypothetical protein